MTTHTCPTCYDTTDCAAPYCNGACHDSNCRPLGSSTEVWECKDMMGTVIPKNDPNCMYFSCIDCIEAAFIDRLEAKGIFDHGLQGGNPRIVRLGEW